MNSDFFFVEFSINSLALCPVTRSVFAFKRAHKHCTRVENSQDKFPNP